MKKALYFGVDVGATFTKTALVDEMGRVRAKSKISSDGFCQKPVFSAAIKDALLKLLSTRGLALGQVKSMGIGLPGQVDFGQGVVINLTNIKGWSQFPLVRYLKDVFSIPVFIENDANCMALAESRMGAARGASYALCLTLGTGVGAGLILNREIYRSPYFFGGELGHVPVALKGPRCVCGGLACLERFVGNRAIGMKIKSVYKKALSLEDVARRARLKESKAVKIWEEIGEYVGLAVSGVVNFFNTEVVVVGGGVSLAGQVLLRSIQKTVKSRAMNLLKNKVKVKRAALGNDAGVLGAAILAKEGIQAGCPS